MLALSLGVTELTVTSAPVSEGYSRLSDGFFTFFLGGLKGIYWGWRGANRTLFSAF